MANKKQKGLAADLRTAACVWFGTTSNPNENILILKTPTKFLTVLVEVTDENIILKAPSDVLLFKNDIATVIFEMFPEWKEKQIGSIPTSTIKAEVVGDYNSICYGHSIKVLPESRIRQVLKDAGIDINKDYEYESLKIDNSSSYKLETCSHGYENYPQEVLDKMVDVSKYKTYEMDPIHEEEYIMLDDGCFPGLISEGPASTGKSTDPLIYCAKHEIPIVTVQCTRGTETSDILGEFIPKEDGGFKLRRGVLSFAVEHDIWCVINEANYAPAGVMSCLNSLMDDNGQIELADGTMLYRGPNFRLILTCNCGYIGTELFNEATLNRFSTTVYEPITKEVLIKRLEKISNYHNPIVLTALAEQFDKIRGIYESKNMDTEVTLRNAERFLKMINLHPEFNMEHQFDIAFIFNARFAVNDVSEIHDLQEIRKDMVSEIKAALSTSTEEAKEGSLTFEASADLDDLVNNIEDDGSFLE